MKLSINAIETQTTYVVRKSIELDTEKYPELDGKKEHEVEEYIRENMWDMDAVNPDYVSLGEELINQDRVSDGVDDYDMETNFHLIED